MKGYCAREHKCYIEAQSYVCSVSKPNYTNVGLSILAQPCVHRCSGETLALTAQSPTSSLNTAQNHDPLALESRNSAVSREVVNAPTGSAAPN
jgi:hypothetical protein